MAIVKEMFETKVKRKPIEAYGISFRLLLVDETTVNFEFMNNSPLGSYFKPIGYFKQNMQSYLLYEFEEAFRGLKNGSYFNINIYPESLSMLDNAVIAAFSIDTIIMGFKIFEEVFQKGIKFAPNFDYDKKIMINGLKAELILTFSGSHQFFLFDEYNVEGPIGAYQMIENNLQINPIVNYSDSYNRLNDKSLLSAYKNIN